MEAPMKLEVKKIGNSTGVILPKELLAKLDLKQGQWLYVTELPDGGVRLTPYNPDFEKAMQVVEDLMVEYRDTLKALAK
jgi:putative addiction module antidote